MLIFLVGLVGACFLVCVCVCFNFKSFEQTVLCHFISGMKIECSLGTSVDTGSCKLKWVMVNSCSTGEGKC